MNAIVAVVNKEPPGGDSPTLTGRPSLPGPIGLACDPSSNSSWGNCSAFVRTKDTLRKGIIKQTG